MLRVDSLRKKYQEALVGMRSQQEKALVNVERRHRAALQEQVRAFSLRVDTFEPP